MYFKSVLFYNYVGFQVFTENVYHKSNFYKIPKKVRRSSASWVKQVVENKDENTDFVVEEFVFEKLYFEQGGT